MAQVEPATFGAYGRKVQGHQEDDSKGGLKNFIFSSRCPPDVQPNTRIVALCGISDWNGPQASPSSSGTDAPSPTKKATLLSKGKEFLKSPSTRWKQKGRNRTKESNARKVGMASPREDGWFLSDFYLFHHLFRGLGANQLWITCESPSTLVDRYGEYGHGDPDGEHRAVLNRTLLPEIEGAGNLRVFKRADLLEDFMRTFQAECNMAAALKQPVLLMIFGHGDEETYGVSIGGAGDPVHAPRLRIKQIVACLRGLRISLTMMMTSCYSGGWVLQPELNISAITAADSTEESFSWGESIGRRCHGSAYATAVRLAFVKLEDERATQIHPYPSGIEVDERFSTTYAELTSVIHSTLLHDMDRHGPEFNILFAAQNDDWEMEWRKRSGIPLARFQKQWTKLPLMPAQKSKEVSRSGRTGGLDSGSLSLSEGEYHAASGPYGLHRKLNESQSVQAIRSMAYGYMNGFPGANNMATNIGPHGDARDILEGTELDAWRLGRLQAVLHYRLESMKLASEYKAIARLDFVDCEAFDLESWQESVRNECEDRQAPNYKYDLSRKFMNIFHDAALFDPPVGQEGYVYTKPWRYLGVACLESGLDLNGVKNALSKMQAVKAARVEALTLRIRKDRTIRSIGAKAFTTLGKRLRSTSPPRRRAPLPSFSEVMS